MERLINILIIDEKESDRSALREILGGGGNILLFCDSVVEAHQILNRREAGIVLVNVDSPNFSSMDDFKKLLQVHASKTHYSIIITENTRTGSRLLKGFNSGAVDFITKPFNPLLIQAKLDVYKSLYYKDQRIAQLLGNIFPENVLDDLNQYGKFSPKRVDKGVVLFTDFVDFSMKSKSIKPIKLVKRLEYYFTAFDEIVERYKLEKIKTIGDAYMAIAGVNEDNAEPILRACMAALEMRDFIRNEKELARALKKDYWEIRIGVHAGPLVAGIIGSKRYSFDVWGDTVNIAARAQQFSGIDQITVTQVIHDESAAYFEMKDLGNVPIKKRGGSMEIFELESLKSEYSLYNNGKVPSVELRVLCQIATVDFEHMRSDILNKLKSMLPDEVIYHDLGHTLNVEKAAIRLGKLEGLNDEEMLLLRTAALFHDTGFIFTYDHNELYAVRLMEQMLPKYGFNEEQIRVIREMIQATTLGIEPVGLLQEILCDADHDYLGRADYYVVASKLKQEMAAFGKDLSEEEWMQMQIRFLGELHKFYTVTALNIRQKGKTNRLAELKSALEVLQEQARVGS
ncbi:adenylate/guanylate cyclase domain-containing protein [Fluviicola sp.]|uniref:adenylate/guanylate cyclase domain-containing protein n=1 Tax=Fluviicola sp. TaxID=1917219 RepID=UPI0028293056|nr:adenylate/guanylate cyclase domain-containing protein [Fluviicola sp.]MDR0802094.1 response regulator [Fluviicola sp.]